MGDPAAGKIDTQSRLSRFVIVGARNEQCASCGVSSNDIVYVYAAGQALFHAITKTERGISKHIVRKIIFHLGQTENVALLGISPWLTVIIICIRHARNAGGGHCYLGPQIVYTHTLKRQIKRKPQRSAIIIVYGSAEDIIAAKFIINGYITAPCGTIDTDADAAIGDTARYVKAAAKMCIGGEICCHSGQRFIPRTLGEKVDTAPDA